jgi:hypothetical protein
MVGDMDENRKNAYAFLLCAAFLHLKWDLVNFWSGLKWWPLWRIPQYSRQVRKAAGRAIAFHNLAIFLTLEMNRFSEDRFWGEIEQFLRRFPEEDWTNYRGMFERRLAGEEVFVIKPGG